MKTQRFALFLTIINLVLLIFNVAQDRNAAAEGIAPVLRGCALEIVDEKGKVRAEILVTKPVTVDRKNYPEGTLLRLIDTDGHPGVKLGTSIESSGLGLFGPTKRDAWNGVQIIADGDSSVKVKNNNEKENLLKVE